MSNHIKFTGKLKKDQTRTSKEWQEYGYGLMLAPPRYGKTFMACSLICDLQVKTLVIVHQYELIKQFRKALKKTTNAFDYDTGVSVIHRRNISDLGTHDICLITWQLLNSKNGKKALRKYRNAFGFVLVDEVHKEAAPCFSKVVSKFNSYYRGGLTATHKRKDQMEPVVFDIMGPVVAKGKMKKVPVDVFVRRTEFDPGLKGFFRWHTLEKILGSSKSRNKMICRDVRRHLKKSRHHFAIIATRPVFHVKSLVRRLNDMGISAAGFWGSAPYRNRLLGEMVRGKYRAIVANRAMLLGINVPRWSGYFNAMPSSNAPSYYQEMSRVRTPYKIIKHGEVIWRKKKAEVYDYLDDFGPCYGCFQTRLNKVYLKRKERKKIHVHFDRKGDVDPTCGSCQRYNYCVAQSEEDIKHNTHACHRYTPRKKRRKV